MLVRGFRWVLVRATCDPRILAEEARPPVQFRDVTAKCPKRSRCPIPFRDVAVAGRPGAASNGPRTIPFVGSGPYWNPRWFPQLRSPAGGVPTQCEDHCLFGGFSRRSHIPAAVRPSARWRPKVVDNLPYRSALAYVSCALDANVFPYGGLTSSLRLTAAVGQGHAGLDHTALIEALRALSNEHTTTLDVNSQPSSATQLLRAFSEYVSDRIFYAESGGTADRGELFYSVLSLTAIETVTPDRRPPHEDIAAITELLHPGDQLDHRILNGYRMNDFGRFAWDVGNACADRLTAYLPGPSPLRGGPGYERHRRHDKTVLSLLVHPVELALLQKIVALVAIDEIVNAHRELHAATRHLSKQLINPLRTSFLTDATTLAVHDLLYFQERLPRGPRDVYDAVARAAGTRDVLATLARESEDFQHDAQSWKPPIKRAAAPLLKALPTIASAARHVVGSP